MPTLAETAFAEGFADLASVHGKTWTFGVSSFVGVATALEHDDPLMEGSTDRIIRLLVLTSALPVTPPTRGDEITQSAVAYRVIRRPDADPATGITTLMVVQP